MSNKEFPVNKTVSVILIFFLCLAVFMILPQKSVTNRYMMKVINEGMIYFIAVLGLSVILGMGGQVTFSTAPIMGMGAYITAILSTRFAVEPLISMIIAILASTVFSYFMGLALFRLCKHRHCPAVLYNLYELDEYDRRTRWNKQDSWAFPVCL